MASHSLGLSLHDAARQMGVPFTVENEPADRFVAVNGMTFHYLEWGEPYLPTIMMLHGISQQAHSWDFISLPLSVDYHVIAVDQRGARRQRLGARRGLFHRCLCGRCRGAGVGVGAAGFPPDGPFHGGRNSMAWASGRPGALRSLTIVDTGPETQRRGSNRIQQFRELPDELDTLDEFAQRVMEYTGRSRQQTLGALKYSIRQRDDGKWTWKYDKAMRVSGFRAPAWTPGTAVGGLAQDRLPDAGNARRTQRHFLR